MMTGLVGADLNFRPVLVHLPALPPRNAPANML